MSKKSSIRDQINDLIRGVVQQNSILFTTPLLVEFFDGDHNAAIFANQVLYWTDRTKDPEGWFYKTQDDWNEELHFSYYQVQRVIFGDERVQNRKRNLSDVGLEVEVRMAPNGRNATFYRLDVPQFVGIFVEWLEEKFGALTNQVRKLISPRVESKKQATSQTQPESTFTYEDENWTPLWLQPKEPEVVSTERVQTPWQNSYRPDQEHTIADVWKMAHSQLEIQFDRASFSTYLEHLTLVDYDVDTLTFTLAVKHNYHFDVVRYRLHRNIRRVLSDSFGQDAEITYVTYNDWRERSQ
ncbi:MAG: hypothetical protein AAFU54_26940 [Chloroflexota bacterium]